MTLDQRAAAARSELLAATQVDVARGLAELHATRRRRDTGRRAWLALAAAALVGTSAWATLSDDRALEPAPAPGTVSNGALVGARDIGLRPVAWRVLEGPAVADLPDASISRDLLQFTPDGDHAMIVDHDDRILLLDVTDGSTRLLAAGCPDVCQPSLSPDGTRLAWAARSGLVVEQVDDGTQATVVRKDDTGWVGAPSWSPDGSRIAFLSEDGVRTVAPDGSDLRLVHPVPSSATVAVRPPAFSPDGTRLAVLEGVPRPRSEDGEYDWRVVVVDLDTGSARLVYDAGYCACLGLPTPSVAWSPDGSLLAVATSRGTVQGVHVIRPDGSDDRLVDTGVFLNVAWQPLVE